MNSEQIIKFRRQRKLSPKQLSEMLGVSLRTVQRWEAGHIEIPTHVAIITSLMRRFDVSYQAVRAIAKSEEE